MQPPNLDELLLGLLTQARGLSLEGIARRRSQAALLPVATVTETDERVLTLSCSVCLEVYAVEEQVKTLPCLHMYHAKCIDEWLANDSACPVCKTPIDVDPAHGLLRD